jgi:hypothetical protein
VKIQDVEITLSLKGAILDKTTVEAQQGFYSSNNSSILWSKETSPALAEVAPGESETLDFSFAAFAPNQGSFKNPEITLSVDVAGKRQSETNVPVAVRSSAATKALVATNVTFASSLTHAGGAMPPKADTETAYVIAWSAANTANAVANAVATGVLPSYVRFISSASGDISFNPSNKTVTWKIGDLAASQSKNVSFTVGLTPSVSQVNTSPSVIGSHRFSGLDRYVREDIEATAPPLTTNNAGGGANGVVGK